jgi:PKD repeat protein
MTRSLFEYCVGSRACILRIVVSLSILMLVCGLPAWAQGTVLIEEGSAMVYLANGSDPGAIDWTAEVCAACAWTAGVYGVGYDTPAGSNPLITTNVTSGKASIYTRAEFDIADVTAVTNLFLRADWDDGYAAWINGVEVHRSLQVPAAPTVLLWNTPAALHESSNAADPVYGDLIDVSAALPMLHNGSNVLAIGVWNGVLPSSDLVLVPQLQMNVPVMSRGPYLQMGSDTGVVVRWRTPEATDSRVEYTPEGGSPAIVDNPVVGTDHVVTLSSLTPDTHYFYSVGSTTAVVAGGDADHFFRTAPVPGTRRPIRVWVLGDSGTADANAAAVAAAYDAYPDQRHTDVWLMLGDNAYPNGTDDQYQAALFDMYPGFLIQSVLWPTFGNHDAVSAQSLPDPPHGPYYDMFTLPTGAEAGGESSGTEAYYSFDFGNIHFVCLNSHDVDRTSGGAMLTWLEWDLMNTTQDWIVAFFHHPPYSKGSHDSDNVADSGGRLFDMRENALPILEDWGVDLVLTGHSHSYERSMLLDGHYDVSSTLTPAMQIDSGDGRIDGDGAYQKAGIGPVGHQGAVYVVGGSSGKLSGGSLDHPIMVVSWNRLGSVILDVDGDRLDGVFLTNTDAVDDRFTLVKNTGTPPQADFAAVPLAGAAPLSVDFTDLSTTNTAAWDWDFDAGGSVDATDRNPSTVYATPGTYSVSLTATNQAGADAETKTGYICVASGSPPPVSGVALGPAADAIAWTPAAGALGYDVTRVDLGLLRSSGGDFTVAVTGCTANDVVPAQASDTQLPASGNGFVYVVRSLAECSLQGGYDSGGVGQIGLRDAEIEAAPLSCP